jgi:hypothetical protein
MTVCRVGAARFNSSASDASSSSFGQLGAVELSKLPSSRESSRHTIVTHDGVTSTNETGTLGVEVRMEEVNPNLRVRLLSISALSGVVTHY